MIFVQAKDHVRRLEEQEAEPRDPVEQNPYPSDDERRENWDCESVLTTRTTLYNHPQKLDALPPSRYNLLAWKIFEKEALERVFLIFPCNSILLLFL